MSKEYLNSSESTHMFKDKYYLNSLVKQMWLSSFARVKDLNCEFCLRLTLEQLDAESLRRGDEEGGGIGEQIFSVPCLL